MLSGIEENPPDVCNHNHKHAIANIKKYPANIIFLVFLNFHPWTKIKVTKPMIPKILIMLTINHEKFHNDGLMN